MLMINGYFTHPLFKLSLFGSIFLGCNLREVNINQLVLAQNVISTQIESNTNQGIPINIIPPSPSTTNITTNQNQPIPNIPPLPTSTPAQETLTITGNSTPQRVLSVNGNPIPSDKSLPTPPPLSEPYRKPEIENDSMEINNYEENTVETISISPFDQTPTDEPIISNSNQSATSNININTQNPNSATEVKTPPTNNTKISPSPSPTSPTNNSNSQNYADSQPKRRTLSDILVFSGNNNNQNNATKKPVNNNSAIATNNSNSYKVLVAFTSQFTETQVKSLYPDAFTTQYQGKNFLQVGLFNSKQNAEQVRQSLRNVGLNSILLP